MDEFKVRDLGEVESKSVQEIESALLKKHEQEQQGTKPEGTVETPQGLKEEDVLSHIKNRYGKEINSLEELLSQRETSPELPEDVEAFFKFKKETGRGIDDFVKVQKNIDESDSESVLREYYRQTEEGLDDDDIKDLMDSKFAYDEDLDEESLIKKQKLAKKRELTKAKKFLKEQQESYKIPLESSKGSDSAGNDEEIKAYRDKLEKDKSEQAKNQQKSEWFSKKTDELFGDEFKGFEFNVNDKKMVFKPAEAAELRKSNDTPFNFINKYIGEDGLLKDVSGYHKALSVAMNPEKFAKFFYEQGQADAVGDITKRSKNIDMDTRRAPESTNKGGFQVRSVSQSSSNGLKIRSNKT
jgi:hypothetical protein